MSAPAIFGAGQALRIGLLGGSFNPAHSGHLLLSLEALRRLELDRIWWLVSPQNPLKPTDGMAPFAQRLAAAQDLARHPRLVVSDIEARLGTRRTANTLARLTGRFPRNHFVWLMGADNLVQISRWSRWREIFERVPVAVFARPSYSLPALAGAAAARYRRQRVPESSASILADLPAPAWVFCRMRLDPTSASTIRSRRRRADSAEGK
ncbi:MAG: nicotinate-nucleotide adenylyltransferase [Alphaproteobacteria bacterium]